MLLGIGTALVAGAIASVSGFGIGSLLTPVLLRDFAPRDAVVLVALPHFVASAIRVARLRHAIDWQTFRQFGVASAIGGLAGAVMQTSIAGGALTVVLAVLLTMAGAAELTGRRLPLPRTSFWRLAGGAASGFFGGLVGNQGGIRSAALLGFRLTPQQLVATATASAVIVDAARVPAYLATATPLIARELTLIVVLSASVTAGTLIGVPVLRRVPDTVYQRIVGALLLALGLGLLATSARSLSRT